MLKDTTYKEKLAMLKEWMPSIIEDIKKDLKNEHLKKDWNFAKSYFPQKNLNKLTAEELAQGYITAVEESENGDSIGEFMANRWLLKNTDLYYFFEKHLRQVTDNFEELEELDPKFSKEVIASGISEFGAKKTYLFAVFNSVVFPEEIYRELRSQASAEQQADSLAQQEEKEKLSWEAKEKDYQLQIKRLTDRFEKKLLGMEKKYDQDTAQLKKQVAALQKKLSSEQS